MRTCTGCGTRLSGRRFHGFVTDNGGVVCGRSKGLRTVVREVWNEEKGRTDIRPFLENVETPECVA